MQRYPYFIYPAICELRRNPAEERAAQLKDFIAANVSNREALLLLIGELDDQLLNFYPDSDSSGSTLENDSIDSFIARFGQGDLPSPDSPLFQIAGKTPPAPLSPAPTEPEGPAEPKEEKAPAPEKGNEMPSATIPAEEQTQFPEENSGNYEGVIKEMESEELMKMVKFLVKNHDYQGALDIMEAFYLNNPKKSVYFADQIRFLRKLVLIESKKQQ